ncbi:MAG: hypothetical protein JJT77_03045 [Crocinitomicaceae bacterium]|nr:hypothetical protein [Crocinitomicaceae bacterium]
MKHILILFSLILSISLTNTIAQTEPKVITFKSDDSSNPNISKETLERNVFKLSIIEILAGDFPVYYERGLNNMFSLEFGLGATFGDFMNDFSSLAFFDPDSDIGIQYGLSYSLALRFYPIDLFEEFYVATEFKSRNFRWSYLDHQESRRYRMPRLSLGYAYFYDNNLVFDYFLGVGLNNMSESRYDFIEDAVVRKDFNPRPRLHAGFKIGYVF